MMGSTMLLAIAAVSAHPIVMTATQEPGLIALKVTGLSPTALAARFTIEVTSGTNRSVQSGTARLVPDRTAELVTLRLGATAPGWSAVLRVEPEGAAPYQQRLGDGDIAAQP